jgi:hypothetical protein
MEQTGTRAEEPLIPKPSARADLKLFVSHAAEDSAVASRLVDLLKTSLSLNDAEILFTSRVSNGLQPGETVSVGLRAALSRSQIVLALVSPETVRSVYSLIEIGGAWCRDVLLLGVVRESHRKSLKSPLNEIHSMSLDDRESLEKLIETLRQKLNRPLPADPDTYSRKVDQLIKQIQRDYPADPDAPSMLARILKPVKVATWIVLLLFAALMPFPFQAQLYQERTNVPLSNAQVLMDGRTSATTDKYGYWTVPVTSLIPRRHTIAVQLEGSSASSPSITWFGPLPWYLLSPSPPVYYLSDKGTLRSGLSAHRNSGIVYAATTPEPLYEAKGAAPTPGPLSLQSKNEVEIGFYVESVRPLRLPGLIFKVNRGYLEVLAGKTAINCLSPRTLNKETNYFPVKTDSLSWLPLTAGQARKFGQLYCRLPTESLSRLRRDDRMQLKESITVSLVAGDGSKIDEFNIDAALASPIGKSTRVVGRGKSEVVINPSLAVDRKYDFKLSVTSEGRFIAAFKDDMRAPFDVELGVSVKGQGEILSSFPVPIPKGSRSALLPNPLIETPDRNFNGRAKVTTTLPKSIGGDEESLDTQLRIRIAP